MQRLELTWIGKGEDPEVEPRILIHDPSMDYGDPDTGNMLIHGDNLLALKALEQDYAGKIKCIYIDPPYNTGSAFEYYDDNLEHSTWLNLMYPRLKVLRSLLSEDGSIWVNLDDTEAHYFKVLCDEIFGRYNFLADVVWEKSDSPKMDAKLFSSRHDHLLVYAKNKDSVMINRLEDKTVPAHYNKRDEQGRAYYLKPLRAMGVDGYREKRPALYFGVEAPDGTMVYPKNQDGSDSRWRWSKEKVDSERHRLEWVNGRNGWSLYFRIYHEDSEGTPPSTIWKCDEVGSNRTSKKESKALFGSQAFDTPKPEALIKRVIEVATLPGDLVLDSFIGSGTTIAVAHKMERKYIGIELGEHCYSHCKPRLDKVIDGEQGGVSKEIGWMGGGGYKFYELAPTLLVEDSHSNPVFSDKYSPEMLVAAVTKLNGFHYAPDSDVFWKQGYSQDKSYIYVTTQYLTTEMLDNIAADMDPMESLLVCAPAFDLGLNKRYDNITVKKIPQSVLDKCEYGVDNYNLNIVDLPVCDDEEWEDD